MARVPRGLTAPEDYRGQIDGVDDGTRPGLNGKDGKDVDACVNLDETEDGEDGKGGNGNRAGDQTSSMLADYSDSYDGN